MKPGQMNVLEMMKQWKNLNLDSESLESCAINGEQRGLSDDEDEDAANGAAATSTAAASDSASSTNGQRSAEDTAGQNGRSNHDVTTSGSSSPDIVNKPGSAGTSQAKDKVCVI